MKECPRCLVCREDGEEICASDDTGLIAVLPGNRVIDGKYRLDRRLGEGGMGLIYEARHLALQRSFALKLIRPRDTGDPEFGSRFRLEAAVLGRLKHPNIVDVTDFGVDPRESGVPYLVMELLKGSSLADHVRNKGPLEVREALPVFQAIALAIDFAHENGVLHRDVKPANVFLLADASPDEGVKVLDFGVARLMGPDCDADSDATTLAESLTPADGRSDPSSRLTQTGLILGSIAYMPPEVARAEPATPASDIYSFGVLIYETLVGRPPFEGNAREVLIGHVRDEPRAPSSLRASLSEELDVALLAPLEKVAEKRPALAADVVAGIRAAAQRIALTDWRRVEIPRRFGIAVALGIVVTAASALLCKSPPLANFEERTVDARFRAMTARAPDLGLLLVSVDDASLEADPTPLPQKADEFGRELEQVFGAGARVVGVDLLLPETWSHSSLFSDVVLRHGDRLTLAALSTPAGTIVGPEAIAGLTTAALGPNRAGELFGLVNVRADRDRIVRKARLFYRDRSGAERPTWAARVAATAGAAIPTLAAEEFRIDYSADLARLRRISWKDLASTLDQDRDLFANRIVLVGAEFAGAGDETHPIPAGTSSFDSVSGLVLQALVVNTLLGGMPFRDVPRLPVLAAFAVVSGAIAFGIFRSRRPIAAGAAGLVFLAAYVALAFLLFRRGLVLPVAEPGVIVVLTLAAAVTMRQRLAPHPGAEVPTP